ncbi:efflux RND transporter periplasmic adaptor subunit [Christiangramia forsetii]|uniref:HlyD family secretion protein n=2 Tax=Christiangramia forsetii TaxID=411153 RepID=A0LXC4_CHRFK|nr:efflux RND transporter periplasmic adaptor subunit [Christiangramia forsetii]GGG27598.1 hemolysin D [Christiangramia forsetii]CAL65019.1 HlyD family secretion protein [Christiangramia forsetii KT0803]
MKIKRIILLTLPLWIFFSCGDKKEAEDIKTASIQNDTISKAPVQEVMLNQAQFDALGIKKDTLTKRVMSGYVEVNGELEVPPQSEARVTTVFGANITRILVIEGEDVKKGQVLAYITHPDIIKLQSDFLNAYNDFELKEKEFNRQEKLYNAGVGSGELFQRSEAALKSAQGRYRGLRSQVEILNLNPSTILDGNIQRNVPLVSPIEGAVQKVNVKTGQFVEAQTSLFEIVNTHHVHVDLMVFEKDVSRVQQGQTVKFTVESLPGTELTARILSISKTFEDDPKALHAHAEINNKPENLIPGMYVRGRILVEDNKITALPEDAVVRNNGKYFIFTVEAEGKDWSFKPVEVKTGTEDSGWIQVDLLRNIPKDTEIAYNNAYYLMAEMQKGEGGHGH